MSPLEGEMSFNTEPVSACRKEKKIKKGQLELTTLRPSLPPSPLLSLL